MKCIRVSVDSNNHICFMNSSPTKPLSGMGLPASSQAKKLKGNIPALFLTARHPQCHPSLETKCKRAFLCFLCRFERLEVLAVFASTVLVQLGALFILKERCVYVCVSLCFQNISFQTKTSLCLSRSLFISVSLFLSLCLSQLKFYFLHLTFQNSK